MRVRRLHRIFAFSMATLMMAVSAGFSVDFHYCQGEFKNFALFKKAKSCHELAEMKASCHMASDKKSTCHSAKVLCDSEEENGCCDNETKLVNLDIDYNFGSDIINSEFDEELKLSFVLQNSTKLTSSLKSKVPYLNYKPPLIVVDKTILYQSFLC